MADHLRGGRDRGPDVVEPVVGATEKDGRPRGGRLSSVLWFLGPVVAAVIVPMIKIAVEAVMRRSRRAPARRAHSDK